MARWASHWRDGVDRIAPRPYGLRGLATDVAGSTTPRILTGNEASYSSGSTPMPDFSATPLCASYEREVDRLQPCRRVDVLEGVTGASSAVLASSSTVKLGDMLGVHRADQLQLRTQPLVLNRLGIEPMQHLKPARGAGRRGRARSLRRVSGAMPLMSRWQSAASSSIRSTARLTPVPPSAARS
jgi:hypothetical protein